MLQKMISKFNIEVLPQLLKRKKYYDGIQEILNKKYSDANKPCSRTVINYCKTIADAYCGYLATPGYISYTSNNDIEEITEILKYNDYAAQDAAFLLDALIYGTAAELMFIDAVEETKSNPKLVKTKKFELDPLTVEDAEAYMEALDHNFYVFLNAETGNVNIIYKRNDKNYGLIEVTY